jgi:hypothetical protein
LVPYDEIEREFLKPSPPLQWPWWTE